MSVNAGPSGETPAGRFAGLFAAPGRLSAGRPGLPADDHRCQAAGDGPGRNVRETLRSGAADLNPKVDTSEKSLPGPAETQPLDDTEVPRQHVGPPPATSRSSVIHRGQIAWHDRCDEAGHELWNILRQQRQARLAEIRALEDLDRSHTWSIRRLSNADDPPAAVARSGVGEVIEARLGHR